ncbi:hypothetical protein NDU88_004588 [Pleurodeles waltl]|uniref:ribonuclease H n=1 Tax=Pleurodeles waltl TaxID=8319 RepID=A0AAV7V1V4_PLEWA|nr:hypothetical protein NDU88_004588 [Pleurodeles waltl]
MAYYAEEEEQYEQLQENPSEHHMEERLVEALGFHVQDSVNWALIQALKPFTQPLSNFARREFLGEGSQPRRQTGESGEVLDLNVQRSGGTSSAEILSQMATSVLREHAYGGLLPPQSSSSFPVQASSQSSYPQNRTQMSRRWIPNRAKNGARQSMALLKRTLIKARTFYSPRKISSILALPSGFLIKRLQTMCRTGCAKASRKMCATLLDLSVPALLGKVADTPELDPNMASFLRKFAKDPKKGLDRAWKGCQDKLLDLSGPLTKILDLAVESKESETPLDTEAILQWAQRAICLLGNANCAMSAERRRSFLIRLDPKLAELAINEAGPAANGMLFGEKFISNLSKYVATFTALDKAQSNIKKVFNNTLFLRAGRFRGRAPGRRFQNPRYASQGNRGSYSNQGNFYPNRYRGRGRNSRGYRGANSIQDSTNSAPWCFTKLLRPVVQYLRERGVRLIIYLDDILIMAQEKDLVLIHLNWTIKLLQDLGFVLNSEKSSLIPSQNMEFLGFQIDSLTSLLILPVSKRNLIKKELRRALASPTISLRTLARLVGLLASSIQAIFPGPLHYRALQRLKIRHLQKGLQYSELVPLSEEAKMEISWWLDHMDAWNGRAIFPSSPDVVIELDASRWGWGARCGRVETGGRWSPGELSYHINCLELLAGSFAIKSLAPRQAHCCILLRMDNVSAVRYINRLGGTRSRLPAEIAKEFWHFCLNQRISVIAEYIPGSINTAADWNSRFLRDGSDWMLNRSIFQALQSRWGTCQMDLFASRLNCQVPCFFSWRPDPQAKGTDAFMQVWPRVLLYAFPPFVMIPRVLAQVRRQRSEIILVTPWWSAQPWFPSTMNQSCDLPVRIPWSEDLLSDPSSSFHPLVIQGLLTLMAWRLSGDDGKCREFRNQHCFSYPNLGPPPRTKDTNKPGGNGYVGAIQGVWIPWGQRFTS